MTEAVLVKLLMCICGDIKPIQTAKACMEAYVNCAIGPGGIILTQKDFDKKCHLAANQEICYK